MKRNSVLVLLMLAFTLTNAQTDHSKILEGTNVEALKTFGEEQKLSEDAAIQRALEWSRQTGNPLVWDGERNKVELVGIDANGRPVMFSAENDKSAITINTAALHNGGASGLNLEGSGMTVSLWDDQKVRNTHQEFPNNKVTQMDGASTNRNHSTHVAGTMAAVGTRSRAKGMAPQARVHAYSWTNNVSEMTGAAATGMLVSNHSYGTPTGWGNSGNTWYWYGDPSVSTTEDYEFGFYGDAARNFDQIAANAPYFLIVKSAGNDRGDGPPGSVNSHYVWQNGGWVISTANRNDDPTYGSVSSYSMAKNILVVGAVEEIANGYSSPTDVVMSNFSCWGPTDDGRIRPDVVAKGVAVYSSLAGSNTSYASWQGTSMAAPSVAGSSILLQEHYENVHGTGQFMRSSTVKGLIIHTAEEAGSYVGPDYKHGWGLMNTREAAETISDTNAIIMEETLGGNSVFRLRGVPIAGENIRATLTWIDPAASVGAAVLNDQTLKLINDLDMRITRVSDSTVYSPYILNPAAPGLPASTGDNFRDNVEQVYIYNPSQAVYELSISHKGSIGFGQQFSLVITGFEPIPISNFSSNKTASCRGGEIEFAEQSDWGATNYQWSFPGGSPATSTFTLPKVTYNTPGTYDVTLIVSNNNGGADTMTKSNFITVYDDPVVEIDSVSAYCRSLGTVQTFGANFPGGTWNGGTWMPFPDTVLFVPANLTAGDYQLSYLVSDSNGCVGHDTTLVAIRDVPVVSLDTFASICNTAEAFSFTQGAPSGGDYDINGVVDTIFNPTVIGAGFHIITYTYTDTNGCSANASEFIEVRNCVGVEEFVGEDFMLFPNPTEDRVTLKFDHADERVIKLHDVLGLTVLENRTSDETTQFDLSGLPAGSYLIVIDGVHRRTVIKQ